MVQELEDDESGQDVFEKYEKLKVQQGYDKIRNSKMATLDPRKELLMSMAVISLYSKFQP